jgi:LysM repeat protein
MRRGGGLERYVLALALLVPLAIASLTIGELAGPGLAAPSGGGQNAASTDLPVKRPIGSAPDAPPTLAPPTLTPAAPTATPEPQASATPRARTYVVQRGDELKNIAAAYRVDIFALIRANHISDPDNLRVGQELQIPDQ